MLLTTLQKDRAAGVLLGQAIGDALGVPYEFASRITAGRITSVTMATPPIQCTSARIWTARARV